MCFLFYNKNDRYIACHKLSSLAIQNNIKNEGRLFKIKINDKPSQRYLCIQAMQKVGRSWLIQKGQLSA